ncbi:hypothetical protein QWY81_17900 [Polaribacter undariae]|uniref:Uncharacterized protein n=1 Tax=Polaribacter sejongensis TaxID=985043 RepID=A0AAJ1R2Y4_9FLAO|nr:hypothetical protein [Polaribacter undariae]MDN3621346.1 hypothetical protein [Polaribacter undariae]UWD31888.1 hypothetical protein NQP51_17365 [Polaribacter undariae]
MKPTLEEIRETAKELGVDFKNSDTIANIEKKIAAFKLNEDAKAGNVSKAQLEAWKKKYGKVFKISVKVSEKDTAIGYLRTPNRDHKAIGLSLYHQNKILETGEFLLQNCWLGGDDRLKDDEKVADSAAIQANKIVNFLEGSSEEI